MRRKILFAVMALLTMATGKIWAQETPYVVYDEETTTLYFLCDEKADLGVGSTITIGEGTDQKSITLAKDCFWSGEAVTNTGMIRPNWKSKNSEVTKVVFEPSFANAEVKSCFNWFNSFTNLTAVTGLENLKTSSETSMQGMFAGCGSLTSLDLSNFDTSKVSDMSSMFGGSALTSLDLSKLNTSNVTKMTSMFEKCNNMTSLDLSNFDTSNVTNMVSMFKECNSLTSLDLSNFDTSKVSGMTFMFSGCSGLTTLDLSSFDTSKVSDMTFMFYGCNSLSLLDLSEAKGDVKISDVIGEIPQNVYPVIFVPIGTTVTGNRKNVINGDACESLVIDANNITTLSLPYSFTANSVTFKRSFAAGKAHTICLPFAISSATADYKLYEYDAYKDGKVKFKDVTETTPHKPYLLVPNTEVAEITVENATISATTSEAAEEEKEGFFGVYKKMEFTVEVLDGDYDYYGWTGNTDEKGEFRKAGEGAYVNACRAYIKLKKVSGNNAPARLSIELGDGTTGISSAKSGADGGADAPMYNLQGLRVSGSYRGVVIKNGKKMIVK